MKKRSLALVLVGILSLSMIACGKNTDDNSQTTENETESSSAAEATSEQVVGLANPWRDCTEEEANKYMINGFSAPEGAVNEKWSLMEAKNPTDLPGTMVQLTFDMDNVSFVARQQQVSGEEAVDISGMYYDWTVEDEGILANWADGNMPCKFYRFVGVDEYVDVALWFDIETGVTYSLSAQAPDLDGFDIQAIAEQIYDPAKQESALIPDDDAEDSEYKIESLKSYAEETAPTIDVSGCDTFTQVVDKKLSAGMGYANSAIQGTDLLLVSSGTFDDLEGNRNAIDATVFEYKDGVVYEIGKMCSGGTAYPITESDGYIYCASNHWVCKYAIADDKLMIMEKASVSYDAEGNGTYCYESEDGGDYSYMDSAEAENIFDQLLKDMMNGDVIEFTVVE